MKKGVPVSPGIAIARAYRLDEALACRSDDNLDDAAIAVEIGRFDAACSQATLELDTLILRVGREVGEDQAAVFRAHRLMLRDPALVAKVHAIIREQRMTACQALQQALDDYTELFAQISDSYLRERLTDIRDVVGRITAQMVTGQAPSVLPEGEAVVLVAPEILPSQAVMFDRFSIAGIATEIGGTTGHAAILARSLGIPAASGFRGLLRDLKSGDLVVLDGREGHLIINPGPEVEAAYHKLRREFVDLRDRLIENREVPSVTPDGDAVELFANVNSLADALAATRVGATGVGLYRTEYLFLAHPSVPDEEEQTEAYQAIIEASPNRRVTIRTLDLGGDKQVPYLGSHREANPFMGWRSIRMSVDFPELLQTQLRAILRAGRSGSVSILFPMVSTVEEMQRLRKAVTTAEETLTARGIPFADKVPIGAMIEVPSSALCTDLILEDVDFVSIGSNDLIQYIMAADRDNPRVAHLCEPFTPAIFRILRTVIKACVARGKPVTLCGEMAARPRCVLPLFGMGLRRLSMSPAFVPTVKEFVRAMRGTAAKQAADQVVRMRTVGDIRGYLTRRVQQICPNIALLDTHK